MLPKAIQDAIDDYDAKVADGRLTFTHSEFADIPPGEDQYLREHCAAHLSAMDMTPAQTVPDEPYQLRDGGFHPRRPDGQTVFS